SPPLPETLDISEVAKAADATLRRMGIATPSGEVFRKGTPVC
ncbi:PerC family transcriptional regulator, partial [Escherichia coli]|nr:PerC family transcriptional regulator [Escherichia coli]EGH6669071.1 PerC family transcriptional regulator [Escherichia coli]